jgi:hypothetical protein
MAYLIIGLFIVFLVAWAWYMSKTHKQREVKFQKPRVGGVRRFARAGRVIVQTDEQRSELIMKNRVRYDPSIDRLDPRHPEYKKPQTSQGAAESE